MKKLYKKCFDNYAEKASYNNNIGGNNITTDIYFYSMLPYH